MTTKMQVDEKRIEPTELQKMRPHHRTIALLAAAVPKKTQEEIAEIVGFHQQSISQLLKTPLMVAEIARLQGDVEATAKAVHLKMLSLADRSVQVIEENLGDPDNDVEPKVDRAAMTQDAWKVYETAMGKRGQQGGISINVQVGSFMKEAQGMTDIELTENVIGSIKDSYE